MNRLKLYRALKEANYPQGGQGAYLLDPETDERVYLPRPEEIYNQYLADPKGWEVLTDYMAQAWIENTMGKKYEESITSEWKDLKEIVDDSTYHVTVSKVLHNGKEVTEEYFGEEAIDKLTEREEIKEVVEIVEVKPKGKGKKKTALPPVKQK